MLRTIAAYALSAGLIAAVASCQTGTLSWGNSPTTGPYLVSLSNGTVTRSFNPDEILKFRVWDTTATPATPATPDEPLIEINGSACSPVRTGNVITFTSVAYGLSATLTFTPATNGMTVTASVTNKSARYALAEVEAPRLNIVMSADEYAVQGYAGGRVMKDAGHPAWNTGSASYTQINMPSGMGFQGCYDAVTRDELIYLLEDDIGYLKRINQIGHGLSATWGVVHAPPDARTAGNDFQQPYVVRIEVGRGAATTDGRLGFYDIAERYRAWGTNSSRPWFHGLGAVTRWPTRVSPRVLASNVLVTFGTTPISARPAQLAALKGLLGISDGLSLWYGWYDEAFDNLMPDYIPPVAGYDAALGAVASQGWHVEPYEVPMLWDLNIPPTSPFSETAYVPLLSTSYPNACGPYALAPYSFDITALLCANVAGAPYIQTSATMGQLTFLDQRFDLVPELMKNVLKQHVTSTVNAPHGMYLDYFGGGGPISSFNAINTTPVNVCTSCASGNDGKWESGKRNTAWAAREALRECDSSAFTSTENPEEWLMPAVDVMHTDARYYAGANSGLFWLYPFVYGEFQRCMDPNPVQFTDALLNEPNSAVALGYMSAIARRMLVSFHATGVLALRDDTSAASSWMTHYAALVPGASVATLASNPPAIPLYTMKMVHDKLQGYLPYIQGRRMRALPNSWEGDLVSWTGLSPSAGGGSVTSLNAVTDWTAFTGPNLLSSLWQAADHSVGLLISNTDLVGTCVTVTFDPTLYGFTATQSLVVEQFVGGTWVPAPLCACPSGGSSCCAAGGCPGSTITGATTLVLNIPALSFEVFRIR